MNITGNIKQATREQLRKNEEEWCINRKALGRRVIGGNLQKICRYEIHLVTYNEVIPDNDDLRISYEGGKEIVRHKEARTSCRREFN